MYGSSYIKAIVQTQGARTEYVALTVRRGRPKKEGESPSSALCSRSSSIFPRACQQGHAQVRTLLLTTHTLHSGLHRGSVVLQKMPPGRSWKQQIVHSG